MGLIRNLFLMLHNIITVVGIVHWGHICKWIMYVWMIVIAVHIDTKLLCSGVGWYESSRSGEVVIELMRCLIIVKKDKPIHTWTLVTLIFVPLTFNTGL